MSIRGVEISAMLKKYSEVPTNKRTHAKAHIHKTTGTLSRRDVVAFK